MIGRICGRSSSPTTRGRVSRRAASRTAGRRPRRRRVVTRRDAGRPVRRRAHARRARGFDELAQLARVLAARPRPRRRSTRRHPTAAPSRIASPTLCGVRPPASSRRTPLGAPSASRQSNTRPDPGSGESTRIDVGRAVGRGARARDRRPRTPGSRTARARGSTAPRDVGSRPCSCTAVQPDAGHDLDDVLGPLVAEHADGRAPRAAAACTMSRTVVGVHLPPARREHEAERVGAERDREQRVVLVGDPADLDEHASLPVPQASIRRPWL